MPKNVTPAFRAEVVRYFDAGHTAAETSEYFEVPIGTVYSWTKAGGRGRKEVVAQDRKSLVASTSEVLGELAATAIKVNGHKAKPAVAASSDLQAEVNRLKLEVERWQKIAGAYKTLLETR